MLIFLPLYDFNFKTKTLVKKNNRPKTTAINIIVFALVITLYFKLNFQT